MHINHQVEKYGVEKSLAASSTIPIAPPLALLSSRLEFTQLFTPLHKPSIGVFARLTIQSEGSFSVELP